MNMVESTADVTLGRSPLSAARRSIVVHQQREKHRRELPIRRNVQSLQPDPDGEAAGVSSSAADKQQQTSAIFSCIHSPQSPACSLENPLSCAVGEISARQGALSLTGRRVYTDSSLDLSGDFTGKRFQ